MGSWDVRDNQFRLRQYIFKLHGLDNHGALFMISVSVFLEQGVSNIPISCLYPVDKL